MQIQDLLKMDMSEATQWLIDNQYDFEITKKPMFTMIEDFEDAVDYKVDTAFKEGFDAARMPSQ
jgi:hypothetical protein